MVLSFSVTSCSVAEECFSCDPEIDAWVKENKSQIQSFSRAEIATYSHTYQKGILALLTPERKKALWQEKVDHILTLDLSVEEIEYLKWYSKAFKVFNYKEPISKELNDELYQKTIEGMEKFGWSENFVYQTFFVLGDVDLDKEIILNKIEPEPQVDCTCNYNLGCPGYVIDCHPQNQCTRDPSDNCGVFGGSECTGICY